MSTTIKVLAAMVHGIAGRIYEFEIDAARGQAGLDVVGVSEAAARETRVRVLSALRQFGHRPTGFQVNATLPPEVGPASPVPDLPIALGILSVIGVVSPDALAGSLVVGELSLDGQIRPVAGVLPMVVAAVTHGVREIIVPAANMGEAAIVPGVRCVAANTLSEVVDNMIGTIPLRPVAVPEAQEVHTDSIDLADVCGQAHVKRAMEVAAVGGHPMLMVGPPGSGKTMLARRLITLLPPMTHDDAMEVTAVHSVAGLLRRGVGLVAQRPFRAPHQTASATALAGGGNHPRPGDVSLAHHGVLFLDELSEWRRDGLEVIGQCLENRQVTLTRAMGTVTYPASFLLVAGMTPCACGFLGDPRHRCSCTPQEVGRYRARVSRPLLDRIDIHVEVPAVPFRDVARHGSGGETSEQVRARVVRARAFRSGRTGEPPLSSETTRLLDAATERLGLTARAVDSVLHVARTIADLDESEAIRAVHLSEAIQYRLFDRAG